jgi:putative transposase
MGADYKQSWTLSDELWERIKGDIPQPKRDPNRTYQRKPGGGQKPLDPRRVLEGILYVLRTGCQWKALPKEYGAASSVHAYFQYWRQEGFFEKMWAAGLEAYAELEGIGWEWQSIDGNLIKAPLALEAVGRNPTDRGKKGDEAQSAR